MALENAAELAAVLDRRERLGLVFARHAYGMRAWVDLFSARVASIEDPDTKALVATLVADDADAETIDGVRADVARMLARLRPLVDADAERLAAEAHERYRVRELVET